MVKAIHDPKIRNLHSHYSLYIGLADYFLFCPRMKVFVAVLGVAVEEFILCNLGLSGW